MSNFRVRPLTIVCVAVAIVFVVIGVVYVTKTAGNLPACFPGHAAHSAHTHVKHGLAAFALTFAALAGAWFITAPRKPNGRRGPHSSEAAAVRFRDTVELMKWAAS